MVFRGLQKNCQANKQKTKKKTEGNKLLIKVSDKEYEHVFKFWDRF